MRNSGETANGHTGTLGATIFLYGFLANLLFVHAYVHWAYSPSHQGMVDSPTAQTAFGVIGGFCFCILMLCRLRRPRSPEDDGAAFVARGALYGVAAIVIALEALVLGASGYVAYDAFRATGSQA